MTNLSKLFLFLPLNRFVFSFIACFTFSPIAAQNLIKEIQINGIKSLPADNHLKINHQLNDLFIFFDTTDAVQYSYQLSGFDAEAITTPYPLARYTNLKGGSYSFQLKKIQRDGIVALQTLVIEVKLPFSEEWWFYLAIGIYIFLITIGAIYMLFLYNFRQRIKVEHIRNRIAADLHDEVGSTLSSIAISTKVAQKRLGNIAPDIEALLDTIKTDSEETINTIRDTVWAINPYNDSLEVLFERIRSFAFQILTAQDIALTFENQLPKSASLKISMEQRRNVFLLIKEAIHNIAKHSEASKAVIKITGTKESVFIHISDNGKGFDKNQTFEGNGLKNYQRRANEGFLFIVVDSEINVGTTIEVEIPVI